MMLKMKKKILIRADASSEIGAGHLMRMLALGQLLSDSGYEIHFLTVLHDCSVLENLQDEGFNLHYLYKKEKWDASQDVCEFIKLALEIQAFWVVVDGYNFNSDYEQKIKKSGLKLLRVDDIPSIHYYADIILNQNYGAEKMTYSTEPDTKILAGLKHVLIRKEFLDANASIPIEAPHNIDSFRVLISLGGSVENSDVLNFKLIQGLSRICEKNLFITLIKNNISSSVEKQIRNIPVDIEIKTKSKNIAEEMAKADFAVVSAGSTMWELMFMRVPFCAVSLSEAQKNYLPVISSEGLCIDLGWHEDLTSELICEKLGSFFNDKIYRKKMKSRIEQIIDRNRIGIDLIEILGEKI